MPKQTAKFVAAIDVRSGVEDRENAPIRDSEALDKFLAAHQYAWNKKAGKRSKIERP